MTASATSRLEALLNAIRLTAPLEPESAAELSSLYVRLARLNTTIGNFERIISDREGRGFSSGEIIREDTVIDHAVKLRDEMFALLSMPFDVWGFSVSAGKLVISVTVRSEKLWIEGATKLAADVFLSVTIRNFIDPILVEILPPIENASHARDVFFENAAGGTAYLLGGDDIFVPVGSAEANSVRGGDGHDFLIAGQSGYDYLDGGHNNDTIIAPSGAFLLVGSEGDDWVEANGVSLNRAVVYGEGGSDTAFGSAGDDVIYGSWSLIQRSSIVEASHEDADVLVGRGGDDEIIGSVGQDVIFGDHISRLDLQLLAASDLNRIKELSELLQKSGSFIFLAGSDVIEGLGGGDWISAGSGADTVYGDNSREYQNGFGVGDDTIFGGNGNDSLDGGAGFDSLIGGANADTILGGSGNDSIDGGAGSDFIKGEQGYNQILAGPGNDTITSIGLFSPIFADSGDNTADWIEAGSGNDSIIIDGAASVVFSGTGRDTISVSGGASENVESLGGIAIYDFQRGRDKIDLSAYDLPVLMYESSTPRGAAIQNRFYDVESIHIMRNTHEPVSTTIWFNLDPLHFYVTVWGVLVTRADII